jgi:hypothetical protein
MTEQDRIVWRQRNGDVIAFISDDGNRSRSRFIASMWTAFQDYRSLTGPQTAAVRNIMAEMSSDTTADDSVAAGPEEATQIPNGTFEVGDESFRIWTVTTGSLRGKRVVKRRLHDTGEYKAFAFVTVRGDLKVWRSFYEDEAAGARYISAARLLLGSLGDNAYSTNTVFFDTTRNIQYSIQIACRRCNRPVPRLHTQTGLCSVCVPTPTPAAPPVVPTVTETIQRRHRQLMLNVQVAQDALRVTNRYGHPCCPYCLRNDFASPQGRGRHISTCRRRSGNETALARRERILAEFRTASGLSSVTVADGLEEVLTGNTITSSGNYTHTYMPVPPTRYAPVAPNLSQLGTRIGGRVWEQ